MLQEPAATPRKRLQRRHLLFILIAGAGLGIAFFWQRNQPVAMRLVGRYPLVCPGFTPILAYPEREYIICRDWMHKIACFRWDGVLLWSVNIPKHKLRVSIAISPDGSTLAVTGIQLNHRNIYTWRNGRLLGTISLPPDTRLRVPNLQALPSGRVFIYEKRPTATRIILAKGDKIIARGTIAIPYGKSSDFVTCRHSPDGNVFIHSSNGIFTYYTMNIAGDRLLFKPKYTANDPWPYFIRNNLILTTNGAVYNDVGRIFPPYAWSIANTRFNAFSPSDLISRNAIVQLRHNPNITGGWFNTVRVFYPETGQSWSPEQRERLFTNATPDGQFLLADESPAPDSAIAKLGEEFGQHHLISNIVTRLETHPARLVLYQKPGRRCAYIPIQYSPSDWYVDRKYNIMGIHLSPDGKSVYLLGYDENSAQHYQVLHYTW